MTITQIRNAGIATNTWTNRQNVCNSLLFSNEGYLYVSPKSTQFYFEESSELVFVRFLKSTLYTTPPTNDLEYYELVLSNGDSAKKYYVRPIDGGGLDNKIGRYHSVFDLNNLTAIL